MKQLLLAISAVVLVLGTSVALADDLFNEFTNNDMRPLTPAQTAQMRAERDAAKAKWAAMTPAEKTAATQAARAKKLADWNALDRYGVNDDMVAMTKAQTAQAQAAHDAAKAKWEAMTPEQKTAARKALQQKRLADLSEAERYGANNDMSRWAGY